MSWSLWKVNLPAYHRCGRFGQAVFVGIEVSVQ